MGGFKSRTRGKLPSLPPSAPLNGPGEGMCKKLFIHKRLATNIRKCSSQCNIATLPYNLRNVDNIQIDCKHTLSLIVWDVTRRYYGADRGNFRVFRTPRGDLVKKLRFLDNRNKWKYSLQLILIKFTLFYLKITKPVLKFT